MPNIESAKKRVDVTAKKTLQNKMVVSRMKTAIKKYNAALAANDFETAAKLLPVTVSIIDAACSDGALHRNNAARKVSQLNVNFAKAKTAFENAPKVEEAAPVVKEVTVEEPVKKPAKKAAAKKAVEVTAEDKPAEEKKAAAKKPAAKKADAPAEEKKPAAKKTVKKAE